MSEEIYSRATPSFLSRMLVTVAIALLGIVVMGVGALLVDVLELSFGFLIPLFVLTVILGFPFVTSRGILDCLECQKGGLSFSQIASVRPVATRRVEIPYKRVSFHLIVGDILIFCLDGGLPRYTSTVWRQGDQKFFLRVDEDECLKLNP